MINCLQTGGITQERWSGETTEHDHCMPALEFLSEGEAISLGVEHAKFRLSLIHISEPTRPY